MLFFLCVCSALLMTIDVPVSGGKEAVGQCVQCTVIFPVVFSIFFFFFLVPLTDLEQET